MTLNKLGYTKRTQKRQWLIAKIEYWLLPRTFAGFCNLTDALSKEHIPNPPDLLKEAKIYDFSLKIHEYLLVSSLYLWRLSVVGNTQNFNSNICTRQSTNTRHIQPHPTDCPRSAQIPARPRKIPVSLCRLSGCLWEHENVCDAHHTQTLPLLPGVHTSRARRCF